MTKKGLLTFSQVAFDEAIRRAVYKNNSTSCKIIVPKNWIGKEVVVILDKRGRK